MRHATLSCLVLQLWKCWFQVTAGAGREDGDTVVLSSAGLWVEEEPHVRSYSC